MSAWGKEHIHKLLDGSNVAVIKGLRAIAALQTDDELAGHQTRHTNGVGFGKFDAPFLTDLLRQLNAGRNLSPKQMAIARNKVKRYWRQLAEIANATGRAVPVALIEGSNEAALAGASIAMDGFVRKQAGAQREAQYEALAALECGCEDLDGEDKCAACKRRFGYREVSGSW